MEEEARKSRMEDSTSPALQKLDEKQREQLERQDEAEHSTGPQKEKAIKGAEKLE